MISLAWRNIWRNRRRTLITIFSIMFAVFFAVLTSSLQYGKYEKLVENLVETYSGHLQIHKQGYWAAQSLDNSFSDQEYREAFSGTDLRWMIPRLEANALASRGDNGTGVHVLGTMTLAEKEVIDIQKRLVAGELPNPDLSEAVIGKSLAAQLDIHPGDTLDLLGSGYQGNTAAGRYRVSGIIKHPSPKLDETLVILPLETAREFFAAPGRLTSTLISPMPGSSYAELKAQLQPKLKEFGLELMTWQEMMPALNQAISADDIGNWIMLGVLYLVVICGILGTVMMMTHERTYEFGVMAALGMQKIRMAGMVLTETVFLSLIGVLLGILLAMPVILYFHFNPLAFGGGAGEGLKAMGIEPLIPFSLDPQLFLTHAILIFFAAVLISLYPILYIIRLKEAQAIRS